MDFNIDHGDINIDRDEPKQYTVLNARDISGIKTGMVFLNTLGKTIREALKPGCKLAGGQDKGGVVMAKWNSAVARQGLRRSPFYKVFCKIGRQGNRRR